jgi:hypothetical protein
VNSRIPLVIERARAYTPKVNRDDDCPRNAFGEETMKIAHFIVAAAIAIPAVSSFAQSTERPLNMDVKAQVAQVAQEQTAYRYTDSNDQVQSKINDWNRTSVPAGQVTVNMGRYALSVVRPSF